MQRNSHSGGVAHVLGSFSGPLGVATPRCASFLYSLDFCNALAEVRFLGCRDLMDKDTTAKQTMHNGDVYWATYGVGGLFATMVHAKTTQRTSAQCVN